MKKRKHMVVEGHISVGEYDWVRCVHNPPQKPPAKFQIAV
jgi:hypothetical protein